MEPRHAPHRLRTRLADRLRLGRARASPMVGRGLERALLRWLPALDGDRRRRLGAAAARHPSGSRASARLGQPHRLRPAAVPRRRRGLGSSDVAPRDALASLAVLAPVGRRGRGDGRARRGTRANPSLEPVATHPARTSRREALHAAGRRSRHGHPQRGAASRAVEGPRGRSQGGRAAKPAGAFARSGGRPPYPADARAASRPSGRRPRRAARVSRRALTIGTRRPGPRPAGGLRWWRAGRVRRRSPLRSAARWR